MINHWKNKSNGKYETYVICCGDMIFLSGMNVIRNKCHFCLPRPLGRKIMLFSYFSQVIWFFFCFFFGCLVSKLEQKATYLFVEGDWCFFWGGEVLWFALSVLSEISKSGCRSVGASDGAKKRWNFLQTSSDRNYVFQSLKANNKSFLFCWAT